MCGRYSTLLKCARYYNVLKCAWQILDSTQVSRYSTVLYQSVSDTVLYQNRLILNTSFAVSADD